MKAISLLLASSAALFGAAVAAPADGIWSNVLPLPISPISGAVTPTGELLMWSGNSPGGWLYNDNDPNGKRTYYSVFTLDDFLGQKPIAAQITPTVEMFCPGTSNMPDGTIMVNGGSSVLATMIFDPAAKTFRRAAPMNIARAYQANVVTTAGNVFTVGGSFAKLASPQYLGQRNGEVYNPAKNTWAARNGILGDVIGGLENGSPNPDTQGLYRSDNHAWLFPFEAQGQEMVFHAGPVTQLHSIDVNGNKMTPLGPRGNDQYSINALVVQYSPGRIFKAGGATSYGDLNSGVGMPTRNQAYTINFSNLPTGGRVVVKASGNMNRARAFGHAVVIPGGKILLVGGQTNLHLFEDTNGVLEAELYDPTTGKFTLLAPMKVARNYHSLALLTKYGNVFVAGGGAYPNNCAVAGQAPCTANVHFNGEVFTPPYLSQGQVRPAIATVSGANAKYGGGKVLRINDILTVKATGCGAGGCTFELLRIASETHSVNNDQLRVPLQIKTRGAANGDTMAIYDADKPFVMPGYYYLFAIAPNGTPSVAATVQVIR
ncbi:hypothetical protein HDU88_000446 [Geranomyces variabilis]|nr:hypothetical protein HDU88_000446 [Geranomyces variabilis]